MSLTNVIKSVDRGAILACKGERTVIVNNMKKVLYMPVNTAPLNIPVCPAASIVSFTAVEVTSDETSKMCSTSALILGAVFSTPTLAVFGLFAVTKAQWSC